MSAVARRGTWLFAAVVSALVVSACSRADEDDGWLPGDSLTIGGDSVARGGDAPGLPSDTGAAAAGAAADAAGAEHAPGSGGESGADAAACPEDALAPDRLDLTASWGHGHVRVRGTVREGAGNALSLGLSQGGSFVYDEIFRSDLLSVISLESDAVDVLSVDYEPSPREKAAFARTGARPLDPARPVCLDVSLYEKRSLDLLASRHIPVSGTP